MSASFGNTQGPGGLRAWWQRLWRESATDAPAGYSKIATNAAPTELAVQAQVQQQAEAQLEPGRITKEALLRLQPLVLAVEAPPDLLAQRASFWATATHDLCQPAQALALFLERLRRLPPQASADALHGYLQSSMDDLTRLLTGLMELAQIDAGEVQASTMVLSVDELFSRLNAQLAGQAQAKGLRLAVRSKGQSVVADPALLERILLALGRNALQFCERGTVLLSARLVQGGTAVRIDVSDSGPGIAQRDHTKIFEPFAQRNVANPQGPSRPSLGLHIASRHARLLGTGLQLRSALGRGSRFSIVLPLAAQERRDGDELRTTLESIGLSGLRVALLDADQQRARTVGAWLTSWGCLVVNDLNLDAVQTLHVAEGFQAQAIVCAWQWDAPLSAGQRIQALRAGNASRIPACIIYADLGARDKIPNLPVATAVLGQPLQAAQLRAWLRRAVQS
jgi:signal transduction histidine kinase